MYIQKHQQRNLATQGSIHKSSQNSSLANRGENTFVARPLLRILGRNEAPGDMLQKPRAIAFKGETDVYIARAEIELRKAMQSMAFSSAMGHSSLHTLTAMALPSTAVPLLWTIHAFLEGRYQKENDLRLIHHRNRDAQMLYRQLLLLNIKSWANHLLDQVRYDEVPDTIYMPPGHPVPGQTYRCHPFKSRRNFYYPVSRYFSMLFEEREQALISLLSELGATKISISAPPGQSICEGGSSAIAELQERVFEYPVRSDSLPQSIDIHQHPWLASEHEWQSVVKERINRGALSAQFEFDLGIGGMLRQQVEMIGQLIPNLNSMALSANEQAKLLIQVLQPCRVRVEFCEAS